MSECGPPNGWTEGRRERRTTAIPQKETKSNDLEERFGTAPPRRRRSLSLAHPSEGGPSRGACPACLPLSFSYALSFLTTAPLAGQIRHYCDIIHTRTHPSIQPASQPQALARRLRIPTPSSPLSSALPILPNSRSPNKFDRARGRLARSPSTRRLRYCKMMKSCGAFAVAI